MNTEQTIEAPQLELERAGSESFDLEEYKFGDNCYYNDYEEEYRQWCLERKRDIQQRREARRNSRY